MNDEAKEDARHLVFGEDWKETECLNNSEVAALLEKRHHEFVDDEETEVFIKTLQYVRRFNKYGNAVSEVTNLLDTYTELHDFEKASLANLCPETVEEATSLIPSLKNTNKISSEELQNVLTSLKNIQSFVGIS
jgi:DNA-directed RNA polymerase II subunit RPB4